MLLKLNLFFGRVIFVILISQNGCAAHIPPYSTVIRNVGTTKFSDSAITFGKRTLTAGWVSPGNYKVNEMPSAPITEKALVSWQRVDGKIYKQEIIIKSKLPGLGANEEYYLVFDIDENNKVNLKVVVCDRNEPCRDKW